MFTTFFNIENKADCVNREKVGVDRGSISTMNVGMDRRAKMST